MTIKEALKKFPKIETELLLGYVCNKPKEFLFVRGERKLTDTQERKFTALAKRRIKGEPMSYILGHKYFYGRKFKVTPDVLIPRPETEQLIDMVIGAVTKHRSTKPLSILDLGTGSGCIAITLAKQLNKRTQITASDISVAALKVAKQNAKTHKAKIKFVHSDLFNKIKLAQKFDIIVANLPYVSKDDYKKLKSVLRFEPKQALTDGTNQWLTYRKLFKSASKHLKAKAQILLEIDPIAKPYLIKYAKQLPTIKNLRFYKDLQHLDRFAILW